MTSSLSPKDRPKAGWPVNAAESSCPHGPVLFFRRCVRFYAFCGGYRNFVRVGGVSLLYHSSVPPIHAMLAKPIFRATCLRFGPVDRLCRSPARPAFTFLLRSDDDSEFPMMMMMPLQRSPPVPGIGNHYSLRRRSPPHGPPGRRRRVLCSPTIAAAASAGRVKASIDPGATSPGQEHLHCC